MDTSEYVRKLHETQEKDRLNKQRQGNKNKAKRLPSKRH
ncbi:DUF4023 family protein [Aquibacillus sediminis]|nr:DUF4023 family protein [Aquibacillus sediminis]